MNVLLLLPALISLYLVIRGRVETAFLTVYLPALLLLPESYAIRLPHLPPTSAAEFALIPIGIFALYRFVQRASIKLTDILLVLFMISLAASEVLRERVMNDGIFTALTAFISIFLAYMVGRKLIEPHLRFVTIRRIVVLILALGPVGIFEWRMGQNLYGLIGQRLLHLVNVQTSVQLRAGHGRMGAAFSDAEIAGIAFAITIALNAWLTYMNKVHAGATLGKQLAWIEKYHIPGILLLTYLWLTQSRGPMLAVTATYLIIQIPKFKNTKLASALVATLLVIATLGAYQYYSRYTNISDPGAIVDEQQGSALYRRQMNELYQPIAAQGGWLGWGLVGIPHISGLQSIDNEFLLVYLAQGRLGIIILVLITLENIRTLVMLSWRLRNKDDRAFVFSMLGAMAALWISLLTVYMGEQLPQFAFLLVGWSQSIVESKTASETETRFSHRSRFSFQKVFE